MIFTALLVVATTSQLNNGRNRQVMMFKSTFRVRLAAALVLCLLGQWAAAVPPQDIAGGASASRARTLWWRRSDL